MIRLHLHRLGRPGGPPVLFLHGFLGTGADWAETASALGVAALAPDLPGHGRTEASRLSDHGMDACAAALLALIGAEGVRPDLVGYSMGGRLALHLAVAARERFGRVVLVSATPGLADPAERAARVAADLALARRAVTQPLPDFLRDWYAQPLFAGLAPDSPAARAMHARRAAQNPWGLARSLRAMGTGAMAPLWAALPQAAPLAAVTGACDAKFTAIAARMAAVPGISAHRIAGAGHAPHLEQPARFVETLATLLGPTDTDPTGDRR